MTLSRPAAQGTDVTSPAAESGVVDAPNDERFERITRLACRLYKADAAYLGLVDSERLWIKAAKGPALPASLEHGDSVCSRMVKSGQPLVVGDLLADETWCKPAPLLPMRFYAGAPVTDRDGTAVGSLCILKAEPGDPAAFDVGPLVDLSATVSDTLSLWQRTIELTRLAQMDALTGVANRRAFDDAIERAVRRARRTGFPLSLLLLDLDRFKLLNDALGHQAGDLTLQTVARSLSDTTRRPHDFVCRYGGEEFAVLLPDTDLGGARHVAEAIHHALFELALPNPGGMGGQVTASIGIAAHGGGFAVTSRALLASADAALYAAKRSGRNCTRVNS